MLVSRVLLVQPQTHKNNMLTLACTSGVCPLPHIADEDWKKKYLQEKRRTGPIENQLDDMRKKFATLHNKPAVQRGRQAMKGDLPGICCLIILLYQSVRQTHKSCTGIGVVCR